MKEHSDLMEIVMTDVALCSRSKRAARASLVGSVLLSFSLLSVPVLAQPTVEYLGQEFDDFEVCFYPYDVDDPYSGFEGTSYACEAISDKTRSTTYSPAAWFYRRKELISGHHQVFMPSQYAVSPKPRVPDIRRWQLLASGRLDLSALPLGEGEHWSLIIADSPRTRLSVLPLVNPSGEQVPAGIPLMVARVRNGRPVAVSSMLQVRPYATRNVDGVAQRGVFVRLGLEGGMANRAAMGSTVRRLQVPEIVLLDRGGRAHRPAWKAKNAGSLNGMLYFFPDVPEGAATLRVSGGGWAAMSQEIVVTDGVTVVEDAVILKAATKE